MCMLSIVADYRIKVKFDLLFLQGSGKDISMRKES